MNIVYYICLAGFLGVAPFQDITTHRIKNSVNVTGAIVGGVISLFHPSAGVDFLNSLLGFAVALAVGILCWKLKIYRAGDAKLFSAIGAFIGWKSILSCMMCSVIIGAVIGTPFVVYRLVSKKKGVTKLPFAPMIAIAVVITLVFGTIWEVIPAL